MRVRETKRRREMSVEERLHELGIELPEPPPPAGNYIGAVSVGNRKAIGERRL